MQSCRNRGLSAGLALSVHGTLISTGGPALILAADGDYGPAHPSTSGSNDNRITEAELSWHLFSRHAFVRPHEESLNSKCDVVVLSSQEAVFAAAAAAFTGEAPVAV